MIIAAIALAAQIDSIANEAVKDEAGMTIAVVRRGEVILVKGYGLANVELAAAATADTVYHADSITKHLTAGAVLHLVEEKKLSLDDPVSQYVAGLSPSKVCIRHLLNHTSGSVVAAGDRIGFKRGAAGPVIPLRYQGNWTFAGAPDVMVKFLVRDGKAIYGVPYIGGLFSDATRRAP